MPKRGKKQRRYRIYIRLTDSKSTYFFYLQFYFFFPFSMQLSQSSALSICHYSFAASKAYIELWTMLRTFPIGRHITALWILLFFWGVISGPLTGPFALKRFSCFWPWKVLVLRSRSAVFVRYLRRSVRFSARDSSSGLSWYRVDIFKIFNWILRALLRIYIHAYKYVVHDFFYMQNDVSKIF